MPPLRFQAVSFFITYPRINDHSDDARARLLQFIQRIGTDHETELTYAIIARERHHADQQPSTLDTGGSQGTDRDEHSDDRQRPFHWHLVAHYRSKLRLGERSFDFEGNHPHIRTVGRKREHWDNVVNYCRKEDPQPLEFGTPRFVENSVWKEVISCSSRSDAEELLRKEKPRDWIMGRRNIDYALDKMFPMQENPQSGPQYSFSYQNLPQQLVDWKLSNFEYVY